MMNNIPPSQSVIATRILKHAQAKSDRFSFDPFTIMAICNCIISIVKLLYMCYSKESIVHGMKTNSLLHRILLKREIRRNFKDKEQRQALYRSFSEVSETLSEKELHDLMDSIQE